MSYEDVLDIWTGHIPPAKYYFGLGEGLLRLPSLACSGVAAWKQTTPDGKLMTEKIPTAEIVSFDSNAYFIHTEEPDKFIEVLLRFLK